MNGKESHGKVTTTQNGFCPCMGSSSQERASSESRPRRDIDLSNCPLNIPVRTVELLLSGWWRISISICAIKTGREFQAASQSGVSFIVRRSIQGTNTVQTASAMFWSGAKANWRLGILRLCS
jgi:hypothetical protein